MSEMEERLIRGGAYEYKELLMRSASQLESMSEDAYRSKDLGSWHVLHYSSTSLGKQTVLLRYWQSIRLIPLLPITLTPIMRPFEFNPRTSRVTASDADMVARYGFYGDFEFGETGFASMGLSDQAQIAARLKVALDMNVIPSINPFVLATDVVGEAGDRPLTKEDTAQAQRASLEAIASEGGLQGVIGVAVGKIIDNDPLINVRRRLSDEQMMQIVSDYLPIRVYIDLTPEQIDYYLQAGQPEIRQSGWVINVLGPVCKKLGIVKKIECADFSDKNRYQEIPIKSQETEEIITGVPVAFLRFILNNLGNGSPIRPYTNSPLSDSLENQLFNAMINHKTVLKSLFGILSES